MPWANKSYDDREGNTSILAYSGFWFNEGTYNASSTGESGTLSSTSDPNASLRFNFPSPARAFYFYGMGRSQGGFYGICIDCDPNAPNFINIDALNRTDDGKNPPVVLYAQHFSNPAHHVVIIRNQNDTRFDGNSQLTFDRIDLEVEVDATLTTLSSAKTSEPVASGVSSQITTSAPLPSQNVPAIVGGAVGGVVGLLAICAVLFLLLRRRLRNRTTEQQYTRPHNSEEQDAHQAAGFHHDRNGGGINITSSKPSIFASQSTLNPWTPDRYSSQRKERLTPHDARSPSTSYSQPGLEPYIGPRSEYSTSSSGNRPLRPLREVDAGSLDERVTLPPAYGEWVETSRR